MSYQLETSNGKILAINRVICKYEIDYSIVSKYVY